MNKRLKIIPSFKDAHIIGHDKHQIKSCQNWQLLNSNLMNYPEAEPSRYQAEKNLFLVL